MKLTKKEIIIFKRILSELETLKYVGGVDFSGLKNHEGFLVENTINNRLKYPIEKLKELLK